MAEFSVPEAILEARHYRDAILWVYSHMIVLGLMIGVIGRFAESPKLKLWTARLFLLAQVYYTYLDVRTSDSALGDGLYQGPSSIIPALIGGVITILFLHLSLCPAARER